MDFSALFINALIQFWFVIPFFIFAAFIKSAWFKGMLGEFMVNFMLNKCLPKNQYTLIKNVTLPTDDGTTQIDHIVVSRFGVFVIETKNMKGWIFGSANQKQWTQKIFKYTGKFQNPLHQNYKHTQTLARCLAMPSDQIYSVIVFIGNSTFKTTMPDNVTYASGCATYIQTKQTIHFTPEQVTEIVSAIEAGRLSPSFKTNRQHNKHVKEIVAAKEAPKKVETVISKTAISKAVISKTEASTPACEKCGSGMVLRKAKQGNNAGNQFWGCSNFPKCRAIAGVVG